MRSFGPKGQTLPPAERVPFEFTVLRDEEPETHEFRAKVIIDASGLAHMFHANQESPERSLVGLFRIIARLIDNKDGVPAQWEPTPLPLPKEVKEAEEAQLKFRGPDGEIYPMAEAVQFTAFEAGSSRRRWLHLMEKDDEVYVREGDLLELFKYLVTLAGKDRTPKSV